MASELDGHRPEGDPGQQSTTDWKEEYQPACPFQLVLVQMLKVALKPGDWHDENQGGRTHDQADDHGEQNQVPISVKADSGAY